MLYLCRTKEKYNKGEGRRIIITIFIQIIRYSSHYLAIVLLILIKVEFCVINHGGKVLLLG